eukprot:3627770-Rhodomonas_salina.1
MERRARVSSTVLRCRCTACASSDRYTSAWCFVPQCSESVHFFCTAPLRVSTVGVLVYGVGV